MTVETVLTRDRNSWSLPHKTFVFPAGEVGVKYDVDKVDYEDFDLCTFEARIRSSNDFMELMLCVDAIANNFSVERLECNLYYLPYARQDRVCDKGESLSVQVFVDMLRTSYINSFTIFDPHSDVSPVLFDELDVIPCEDIISLFKHLPLNVNGKATALVSPDAGANKKIFKVANKLGVDKVIRCDKIRDVKTGQIQETVVYADKIDYPCFIVDDICDGGRTFIEIAKILKEKGCPEVYLYVTHGIFSKGLSVFDGLIDRIYTTDSFFDPSKVECGPRMEHPFSLKLNRKNGVFVECLKLGEWF